MPLAETVHMHYEYLFWSMAAMVAAALAGGALCGRLQSVKQLVIGLLGLAAAIFAVVLLLARQGGFDELAAMLSIAAFMFPKSFSESNTRKISIPLSAACFTKPATTLLG